MKQISYYNGEKSPHPIGIGVGPINIKCEKLKIREELAANKVGDNKYLYKGAIIKINEEVTKFYSGDLEISIIAESEKILKKAAGKRGLPFNKNAVVEYNHLS